MIGAGKKLHVVVKFFHPVTAGIETNVMETYSILANEGWDVTIHTSKDTYLEKGSLPAFENMRGLKVKRYDFTKFGYFPDIDWDNAHAVCLHNFDIFPHLRLMLFALWQKAVGRKKFKLFLTPHGGFNPEWSIFPFYQAAIKATYHYTFGALLINMTMDGVRAVSEWEKEQMLKRLISPKLVRVISNGIEDEAFMDLEAKASDEIKNKVKELRQYAIQIGRIYPIKNYETALRAIAKTNDLKFVIAGPVASEEYKKRLDELIHELKMEDRVVFLGVIRGVDKFYLIKHAQMMVHMAIWESFCNVVHEGMSQGLVCLVANNTALPYLIKDEINGWCVGTHDDEALAERISYVMANSDSQQINQIRENNRLFGLNHSWRKVAHAMGEFYD